MPKLTIGLSQKVGSDNGAREASINLELDAEPDLVADAQRLHKRIRQVFALLRTALSEELHRPGGAGGADQANSVTLGPVQGGGRRATQAQVHAIQGLARRQDLVLQALLREQCQVERLEDLSVKEASTLIDWLKSAEQSGK